jgi:hypothetical protein
MSKLPTLTELRMFHDNGEQSEIAVALTEHLAAEPTRDLLRTRYLLGTLKQYEKDNNRSLKEVAQLYKKSSSREIGAFVIRSMVNGKPRAIGLATVQPELDLRRYREVGLVGFKHAVPLPPRFAQHTPLVSSHPVTGSFVEAWTAAPEFASELQIAYKELADPAGIASEYHTSLTSWAVEPVDAPHWVHNAIKLAGYVSTQKAHFEHDASRLESPPLSDFYQRVQ